MPVVDDVWVQRYQDNHQRLWIRVAAYAEAHHRDNGHCPLTPGELGRALDRDTNAIWRAITTAHREGWLHPASSARCLVLARANPNAPCPALHKDGR